METLAARPLSERPSPETIFAQWESFYANPLLSSSQLSSEAIAGRIPQRGLRSLHWRYFFGLLPSPTAPSASTAAATTYHLARARSEYTTLKERYLTAPDGRRIDETDSTAKSIDVQINNPLSLESSSGWSLWFKDLERRQEILGDVIRTFPEQNFFRQSHVQESMTDLLFVWAKLNPEIDYRQGLHELLAPLLYALDFDSLPSTTTNSLPHLVLAREFVENDCWTLFSALMQSAVAFYDPRNSIPIRIKNAAVGEIYVQPVVALAGRIYDQHLQKIDPEVYFALEKMEIEPQLFGVRWLRCIFGRELPYDQDMLLWDGLFAADASSLRLIEFIVVALLIRIRDPLLNSDYTGALTLLLRYPAPISSETDYNIPLLISQAIYLRDNVSIAAGEVCNQQNIEVGATAGEASNLRGGRRKLPQEVGNAGGKGHSLAEGVGGLAKGVYDRAEALGINKAFFGTFNDIRRGVNAQAASSYRDRLSDVPGRAPSLAKSPSAYPVVNPAFSTVAINESVAGLAVLRSQNLEMSKAIDLLAGVFEQTAAIGAEEGGEVNLTAEQAEGEAEEKRRLALMSLRHIRDVLAGKGSFDAGLLGPLLSSQTIAPPIPTRQAPPSPAPPALPPKPSTPIPPPIVVPSVPSIPSIPTANSSHPPLLLGTRNHQPLPSLTRVPYSPPIVTPPPSAPRTPHPPSSPAVTPTVPAPQRTTLPPPPPPAPNDFPQAAFSTRSRFVAPPKPKSSVVDPLGASGA